MSDIDSLSSESSTCSSNGTIVFIRGKDRRVKTAKGAKNLVNQRKSCKSESSLHSEGGSGECPASRALGRAFSRRKRPDRSGLFLNKLFNKNKDKKGPPTQSADSLLSTLCQSSGNLKDIDLSNHIIGSAALDSIIRLLQSSRCRTLETLNIENTKLGAAGARRIANALDVQANKHCESRSLFCFRMLKVGMNEIDDEGARAFSNFFRKLITLEEVSVQENKINLTGIRMICQSLVNNENLRILDLSNNTIGVKGANHVRNLLFDLCEITDLNLAECLLKDGGVDKIVSSLIYLRKLRSIDMSGNNLSYDAGSRILESLKNTRNVYVNLSHNNFSYDGIKKLEKLAYRLKIKLAPMVEKRDYEAILRVEDGDLFDDLGPKKRKFF